MKDKYEKQLKGLVGEITNKHDQFCFCTDRESCALPNRNVIISIINDFRVLLFPDYYGKQELNSISMEYYMGNLMLDIHDKLYGQIVFALRHQAVKNNEHDEGIDERAIDICCEFLSKVPSVMEVLATDVQAAFDGDPAAGDKDEIIFSYPGVFALFVYRLAHELYLLKVPLIPRIMTEYAHSRTGIDINPGAQIGKYFFMDHGTGIVIGETSVIGDYVTIYQGVTIGALSTRGGQMLRGVKRHPTIEDNVVIYSGASILGGETVIGKDVVIGSNVFITRSVPRSTRVSLKNQELLYQDRSTQEFKQEF
ncbi:MAG: serine acetyltransferase [Syntrophomonadaceae bacterium]|nr:serine acetyltransferase [Syntrophomonadaceae bacterium]